MILKEIKKIIKDKKLNKDIDIENLCSIVAYSVLQNDFFKNSYGYLGLIKDKNTTRLYVPYLNYAKGFSNNKIDEGFIETKYEEIEHNIYERFNKYKKYIKKEEIERMENFISILKTGNVKKIENELIKKEIEDSLYIPTIMRFLIEDNRDIEFLLIKLIIENLKENEKGFQETKKDLNYMSEYSIQRTSFHSGEDFCLNFVDNDLVSKLVNYRKVNEIEKDKQIEGTKALLRSKRVPEELIPLLISNESKENKREKVLEYYFQNLSVKLIEKLDSKLKEFRDIEDLIKKYKNEIEVVNKELEKKYIELKGNKDISFSFIESSNNIYEDVMENNKLVLLSNKYYLAANLKLNGISYCSSEIKEVEDNRKCILLKTKNQVIGILLFNEEHNNIVKIDYIEINKNSRREGLSKRVLEWLSDYAIEHNKIIVSSSYTENGKSYLPETKQKLNKEKASLFIDFEGKENYSHELGEMNRRLIERVKKIENFNLNKFKKVYDKYKDKLIEEFNKSKYLDYDFTMKIIEDIEKDYKKSIIKRKQKI